MSYMDRKEYIIRIGENKRLNCCKPLSPQLPSIHLFHLRRRRRIQQLVHILTLKKPGAELGILFDGADQKNLCTQIIREGLSNIILNFNQVLSEKSDGITEIFVC